MAIGQMVTLYFYNNPSNAEVYVRKITGIANTIPMRGRMTTTNEIMSVHKKYFRVFSTDV